MRKEWEGFVPGSWTEQIDVEEFIRLNYHPYDGDDSFLAGAREYRSSWLQRERLAAL